MYVYNIKQFYVKSQTSVSTSNILYSTLFTESHFNRVKHTGVKHVFFCRTCEIIELHTTLLYSDRIYIKCTSNKRILRVAFPLPAAHNVSFTLISLSHDTKRKIRLTGFKFCLIFLALVLDTI